MDQRAPAIALRTQEVVDVVSSDEKVLDFPKAGGTSEEKARRAMAEAKRLASLAPGEWRLWIDRTAERFGVPRALPCDDVEKIRRNPQSKQLTPGLATSPSGPIQSD